jgi:hypothetical protein
LLTFSSPLQCLKPLERQFLVKRPAPLEAAMCYARGSSQRILSGVCCDSPTRCSVHFPEGVDRLLGPRGHRANKRSSCECKSCSRVSRWQASDFVRVCQSIVKLEPSSWACGAGKFYQQKRYSKSRSANHRHPPAPSCPPSFCTVIAFSLFPA